VNHTISLTSTLATLEDNTSFKSLPRPEIGCRHRLATLKRQFHPTNPFTFYGKGGPRNDEEEIAVDLVKGGYDPFATLILKPLRKRFLNFIDVIVK